MLRLRLRIGESYSRRVDRMQVSCKSGLVLCGLRKLACALGFGACSGRRVGREEKRQQAAAVQRVHSEWDGVIGRLLIKDKMLQKTAIIKTFSNGSCCKMLLDNDLYKIRIKSA